MGAHRKNRVDKNARELSEIRYLVQRELIAVGDLAEEAVNANWTYKDLVVPPQEPGQQSDRQFRGRAAVVLWAGFVVEESCSYTARPLAQFASHLREFRESGARLLEHAREHSVAVASELSNGDVTRCAGLSFGAQPNAAGPFYFEAAKAVVVDIDRIIPKIDGVLTEIAARQPVPVTAGFYWPKAAGPLAHFAWLLHRDGLEPDAIAEVLDRLKLDRTSFGIDEVRYRNRREGMLSSVRRFINRAINRMKAEGIQADSVETRCAAQLVSIEERTCVLHSILDEHGRPTVVVTGGREAVPRVGGDGTALDSDRTPGEPPARP